MGSGIPEPPQGSSSKPSEHSDDKTRTMPEPAPAVRFASKVEEIAPEESKASIEQTNDGAQPNLNEVTPEQIKELSKTLHTCANLQEQRMKNYKFEAFSLPASRVASNEDSSSTTPQQTNSPMGRPSPKDSPSVDVVSPPLTPSGTEAPRPSTSSEARQGAGQSDGGFDSQAITPQASGPESKSVSPRINLPHRPASEENISQKTTATDDRETSRSHRKGMFTIGPGGSSVPASRESSPARESASQFYSRPFTPAGDVNDPYAASKRAPQPRYTGNIDKRFVFSRKGKNSPSTSSTNLAKVEKVDKRHSGFLGVLNKSTHELHPTGTETTMHSRQSSMSDLRRFFKVGGSHKAKKTLSPAPDRGSPLPSSRSSAQVPFADDHGLTSRYGKIGRVLGSGAGGSVKLMKRNEDNTVFAVKEFRPRHTYETEKEYVKKLTAEFCIGSALHHGNIIETLDIVQEKGKWYEVMEYAPYDLFAIVMTGKMSKAEVSCCFLQILSGVTYLHSMGLAHRDLKLDNVVVSEHGIMKIIDFGSAHVFKYPFESEVNLASGVVGSDPYLAPEVYDERRYDPQAVDIWSLAIIFCCMSLRRFPWKVPRMSDNSFKLFAAEPTPGHDPKKLVVPSRSTTDLGNIPQRDMFEDGEHRKASKAEKSEAPAHSDHSTSNGKRDGQQKEVIRGPWRLLRLLPRESRHVIGRMLTIDPRRRARMPEILEEPWVSDTVICRQIGPGQVVNAEDHTHILEPPATPAANAAANDKK